MEVYVSLRAKEICGLVKKINLFGFFLFFNQLVEVYWINYIDCPRS